MTSLTSPEADLFAGAREGDAPAAVEPTPEALTGTPSDADLRITAKRFVLQAACEKASRVVPSKDTMPVLKNLRVIADAVNGTGRLRIVATDLELSVIATTTLVNVERQGTAVVPAAKFLAIVRQAVDEDVVLDIVDGVATITAGEARWTLRLQAGDDYPELPEVADLELHRYDRVRFLGAIQAVRYAAASLGDSRQNLMMIDITDGKATACDGVRFQQATLPDFPLPSIQIPIGAVDDLVGLLRTTDLPEIEIADAPNHLAFKIGTDVFVSNKLMADFPDVEAMLLRPALANDQELTVDRQDLADAIKRVRINADPESSAVVLRLTRDRLTVEAQDKMRNSATETLAAGWSRGDRTLAVNHRFLSEMLSMYDGRSALFRLGADTKSRKAPVVLVDEGQGTTGIIQQMRADWVLTD